MTQFLRYKNIDLHFSDEGEGKPVVLLHGFLENLTMWESLSDKLSNSNRVIAIDLLGHGQSGCLGYIHKMEDMGDAVVAILKTLNIEKATFIGHSMGGYVCLSIASRYHDLVCGLCLANSTYAADSPERKLNRDRAIEAVKANYSTFVRVSISNLFRPKNRRIFANALNQVKEQALKTPVQGIIAALEGMKLRKNHKKMFLDASYPKMVVIGMKDPVINANMLKEELSNRKISIVELPDGHMSHIENMKEFDYNIVHFIENL